MWEKTGMCSRFSVCLTNWSVYTEGSSLGAAKRLYRCLKDGAALILLSSSCQQFQIQNFVCVVNAAFVVDQFRDIVRTLRMYWKFLSFFHLLSFYFFFFFSPQMCPFSGFIGCYLLNQLEPIRAIPISF